MFRPHENAVGGCLVLGGFLFLSVPVLPAVGAGLVTAACLDSVSQLTTGFIIAGARFVRGIGATVVHGLETVGLTALHTSKAGWNVAQSIPACATAIGLGFVGGSILNLAANAIGGSSLATVMLANPFGAAFAGAVVVCAGLSVTQSILSGKPDQTGVFGKFVGVPLATVSTFLIASTITAVAAPQIAVIAGVAAAGTMAFKEVFPEVSGAGANLRDGAYSALRGTILTAARCLDTLIAPIETLVRRFVPWVSNETPGARFTSLVGNAGAPFSRRAT